MKTIYLFLFLVFVATGCSACKDNASLISSEIGKIIEPNKESIVYVSTQTQRGFEIYLTHDARSSHLLTWGGFSLAPDWSPDKRWITYERGVGTGKLQIWKMRYDGSGKKMLTRPEHNSQVPRWSPDGRFIAFTRMTEDRSDIFIMDTSGNSVRQITTPMNIPAWNELIFGLPDWSRDGEKIICTVSRIGRIEDETSLAIISLVSSDFVVLSSLDSLQPVYPRWSPARDEIAFVGRAPNDTKGPQIYRANIGGQNLKQLSDAFLAREPDWSWDGEWIIYSRLGKSIQDPPELWVMNRDGTHHRKLLGDSVNAYVYGNW